MPEETKARTFTTTCSITVAVYIMLLAEVEAQNTQVNSCLRAVQQNPGSDTAHYCLANALFNARQVDQAIFEYRRAYALTRSEQMRAYCGHMLRKLGVAPDASVFPASTGDRFPAPTVGSLEEFNAMARKRGAVNRRCDSHSDGVSAYPQAPGSDFNDWIMQFRLRFEGQLARVLSARGYASMCGTSQMIFSVDNRHKLRGRILQSDAPCDVTDCLLETTRTLDGRSMLDFPQGTAVQGFNFSMGWRFPSTPQRAVSATLTNDNVFGRLHQTGAHAQAGALNGQLSSKNASGQLLSKDAKAQLTGKEASGQLISKDGSAQMQGKNATATAMPGGSGDASGVTISTDVAGLLLPKPKPTELKAEPALKLK